MTESIGRITRRDQSMGGKALSLFFFFYLCGVKKTRPHNGSGGIDRKRGIKRRKKSMHLRTRATLNILIAQYHRQCYRGGSVHRHGPMEPLFFFDRGSIPKLVRPTMVVGPQANPFSPLAQGHTRSRRCYRTGKYQKERRRSVYLDRRRLGGEEKVL